MRSRWGRLYARSSPSTARAFSVWLSWSQERTRICASYCKISRTIIMKVRSCSAIVCFVVWILYYSIDYFMGSIASHMYERIHTYPVASCDLVSKVGHSLPGGGADGACSSWQGGGALTELMTGVGGILTKRMTRGRGMLTDGAHNRRGRNADGAHDRWMRGRVMGGGEGANGSHERGESTNRIGVYLIVHKWTRRVLTHILTLTFSQIISQLNDTFYSIFIFLVCQLPSSLAICWGTGRLWGPSPPDPIHSY